MQIECSVDQEDLKKFSSCPGPVFSLTEICHVTEHLSYFVDLFVRLLMLLTCRSCLRKVQ